MTNGIPETQLPCAVSTPPTLPPTWRAPGRFLVALRASAGSTGFFWGFEGLGGPPTGPYEGSGGL